MRKVIVLCLAICFVFALTALAFDDMGKSTTVNGWVSDSKCGAKGANAGAEACTKKCLAAGEKIDSHHVELATELVVRRSTARATPS